MSSYSEGQTHQLMEKLEAEKFTPGEITKLGQYKDFIGLRGLLNGTHKIVPIEGSVDLFLDRRLGVISIPATTLKFVASEKFVRDTSCKARVRIGHLSDSFAMWFLAEGGKVEDTISAATLRCNKLLVKIANELIIKELGGEGEIEIALSWIFYLMEGQGDGKFGALLNNGCANVFYAKDRKGMLRTIRVAWYGDSWHIDAISLEDIFIWDIGDQIFFHNSIA